MAEEAGIQQATTGPGFSRATHSVDSVVLAWTVALALWPLVAGYAVFVFRPWSVPFGFVIFDLVPAAGVPAVLVAGLIAPRRLLLATLPPLLAMNLLIAAGQAHQAAVGGNHIDGPAALVFIPSLVAVLLGLLGIGLLHHARSVGGKLWVVTGTVVVLCGLFAGVNWHFKSAIERTTRDFVPQLERLVQQEVLTNTGPIRWHKSLRGRFPRYELFLTGVSPIRDGGPGLNISVAHLPAATGRRFLQLSEVHFGEANIRTYFSVFGNNEPSLEVRLVGRTFAGPRNQKDPLALADLGVMRPDLARQFRRDRNVRGSGGEAHYQACYRGLTLQHSSGGGVISSDTDLKGSEWGRLTFTGTYSPTAE